MKRGSYVGPSREIPMPGQCYHCLCKEATHEMTPSGSTGLCQWCANWPKCPTCGMPTLKPEMQHCGKCLLPLEEMTNLPAPHTCSCGVCGKEMV